MHKLKTQVPKMTGSPGFKNQDHGPSWIASIVAALKAGTSAALKEFRNPISYRGTPPHWEANGPIEPRPVTEISEPVDLPSATADLTRKLDGDPPPPHPWQTKR